MTTLYCPKCGYNLSNLPENRCPECGEWFDPAELRSLQSSGISTGSVVLQLIFVPVLFAVAAPVCLIASVNAMAPGIAISAFLVVGLIVLHALHLSQAYVSARRLHEGVDNVPWIYRRVWPCCTLFALLEVLLTFMYFAGGCAVILMNIDFH